MRQFRIFSVSAAVTALIASGCRSELPSEALPAVPALARGAAPDGYTSVDIGALLGNVASSINGVNDAGDVAGWSCCGAGSGAFARVGGIVRSLSGDGSVAKGLSTGSPQYVVGHSGAPARPMRWVVGAGIEETALTLLADESNGVALGVNDAGDAVGAGGSRAAMWSAAGDRTTVPTPDGFARGEGRAINNTGEAAFVFTPASSSWSGVRGYLRLTSGNLIEIPPAAGDVTTYANDISEVTNGVVYVAGTTRTTPYVFRSARWTIDATTGQILETRIRGESSHGLATSNAGAVSGFLETNAMRTPRFGAFLWRGTEFLTLSPPKGGKDGRAWTASPNGKFVAGEAIFGGARRAVLWTIQTP